MNSEANPFRDDPKPNPYAAPNVSSTGMSPTGPDTSHLASRSSRFGARFLDGIISLLITGPIMFATEYFQRIAAQQVTVAEIAVWASGGLVLYVLLHGYFLATRGQSLGKMAVGIRIVDRDTRQIPSFTKLFFVRELPMSLISLVPAIGGLLSLVNLAFIFGRERRCIHDRIANTIVENLQDKR